MLESSRPATYLRVADEAWTSFGNVPPVSGRQLRVDLWGTALAHCGLPDRPLAVEGADLYSHERRVSYRLFPDVRELLNALGPGRTPRSGAVRPRAQRTPSGRRPSRVQHGDQCPRRSPVSRIQEATLPPRSHHRLHGGVKISDTKTGAPGGTRTRDKRFRKPLLYPLSYRGLYLPVPFFCLLALG